MRDDPESCCQPRIRRVSSFSSQGGLVKYPLHFHLRDSCARDFHPESSDERFRPASKRDRTITIILASALVSLYRVSLSSMQGTATLAEVVRATFEFHRDAIDDSLVLQCRTINLLLPPFRIVTGLTF